MGMRMINGWRHGATALALGVALAAGGCNRANQATTEPQDGVAALPDLPATLPLATGEATPVSYAPDANQLPEVAPLRAVRIADQDQGYAYADAAYDFADALGDAPPDYAFDYGEADPWAWQGYDDSRMFAEPVDDGYRYYYYRPGADSPYFIRDADYGYGYDGGNLAVVYASDGAIVPWADYGPRLVYASRYMARGRDLWRASRVRRVPVIAANWNVRRPLIVQTRRVWTTARAQQPRWVAYRQRYNRDARDYWRPEARRREADTRRFANWQNTNFRTPPPPRAIPANWQRASWARDERRFAPVREERRGLFADRRDEAARERARREQAQQQRRALLDQRERTGFQRVALQRERAQQDAERDRDRWERQRREQARAAQQAQRDRAEQTRQSQRAERQQREQARAAQQAKRNRAEQARQSQRAERQQREQARAAQQVQRNRAEQARQSQRAERQQREQARAAQQAKRAQADQARQSQRAERQQREQARAAQQAQRAQAEQARAARQQQQAQRDQQRAERQAARAERRGDGANR